MARYPFETRLRRALGASRGDKDLQLAEQVKKLGHLGTIDLVKMALECNQQS